jgi:hypothetical protein
MKKWLCVMAVALQALAPAAHAARASASFDVAFRVQESCAIRTTAPSGADAPAPSSDDAEVRCEHQTPYRVLVADTSASPAAPRRAERPHDADAPAALTVWF